VPAGFFSSTVCAIIPSFRLSRKRSPQRPPDPDIPGDGAADQHADEGIWNRRAAQSFSRHVCFSQEAHSAVSLSEILGYSIVDDQERPCGLRLVEWVRGYATLRCLADEQYARDGKNALCFTIPREPLVATLDRVGLKDGAAEKFINQASLRASSRDLFDQPLTRVAVVIPCTALFVDLSTRRERRWYQTNYQQLVLWDAAH
jgi:hypothetical protein